MRLAFVTSEYGDIGSERGGLGYHLARALPLLAAEGHRCEVFLCSGKADIPGTEELEDDGVLVRHFASAPWTPFDDIELPRKVRRHLRSAWTIGEVLGAAFGKAAFDVVQVPNYGLSGLFADVPAPRIMRFSSHARTWHEAGGAPRNRWTIASEMLQRSAMRQADLYFAPSRYLAELVARETALDVAVVRPPIAADVRLDRSKWDWQWVTRVVGRHPYVVHAGQLGRAKGTDLVLQTAEWCFRTDPDLQLHLCGRDAGAMGEIERLLNLYPRRVHYHGHVSRQRLYPLTERALALLAPSRADNLPNAVIEAMSLETPVVAVRGASLDELIVDGQSGFLAPRWDASSLSDALAGVRRLSRADRMAMGRRARARVLELLDERASLAAMEALYRRGVRTEIAPRWTRQQTARHLRADLVAINELFRARAPGRARRGRIMRLTAGMGEWLRSWL